MGKFENMSLVNCSQSARTYLNIYVVMSIHGYFLMPYILTCSPMAKENATHKSLWQPVFNQAEFTDSISTHSVCLLTMFCRCHCRKSHATDHNINLEFASLFFSTEDNSSIVGEI